MSDRVVLKAKDRTLAGFEVGSESKWKAPFFFVQAADTQLGLISNYGDGTLKDRYPNITWDREIELCKQSVQVLNAMEPKPAFFIVCGDLVDAFPEQWPDIRAKQVEDLLKVYSDLDKSIPLICVCGNHDVGNTPTPESIAGYTLDFGDDYFSFWHGGIHFIVLNSQFYEDSSLTKELAEKQEVWLTEQLELSKQKGAVHTVVFQHIPWFLKDPEEGKDYFNIEYNLRMKMVKKLYNGGIRKIFCGHYHRNAGGWYKDMELVVTSAVGCMLGDDPHGMRIVWVQETGIEHKYHALDQWPEKNDLN